MGPGFYIYAMKSLRFNRVLLILPAVAICFGLLTPLPAEATGVESCVGNQCTVTFSFSGEMQIFTPPVNARNLTFDAVGAQGGRSGGAGGKVTGSLVTIPDTLYIYVGGAGNFGPEAAGGFNGGGMAAAGPELPGSGGGATDIRTSTDISSRIVVAGGGGARGAGLGSGGGAGGGLVGAGGRTAQGGGGSGGSQLSGGIGGLPNGSGSAGQAGSLGTGGAGGSSTLLGGGGGGGGYFGGGGGGSDSDICCSGAGGGGGGSSYVDPALVFGAVLTQGSGIGAGRLILRYQLAPMVIGISSEVATNQATFDIEFSNSVTGFEVSDIDVLHSAGACQEAVLSGLDASYQLILSDCDDGEISIAVKPNSVSVGTLLGPDQPFQAGPVAIDTIAPGALWGPTLFSGAALEFSEPIQELSLAALELTASSLECAVHSMMQESELIWQVITTGCDQTDFTLSIIALSVSDASGNLGPISNVSTSFTAEVPDTPDPEIVEPPDSGSGDSSDELPGDEGIAPPAGSTDSPSNSGDGPTTLKAREPVRQLQPAVPSLKEPVMPGSPPASSLPQARQTVTIPAQGAKPGFGEQFWLVGLLSIGTFALLAGLIVARRGIPGALSS